MSREEVIRRIIRREQQQSSLLAIRVLRDDAALHRAACEHFGTWETALQYAGVDHVREFQQNPHTPDGVRRELRRLCLTGYRLTAAHSQHRNWKLYKMALKHFGGWKQALLAAGINPDQLCMPAIGQRLNKEQIVEILIDRHRQGLTLCWTELRCENRALTMMAKLRFGGWRKALIAAGLSPQESTGNLYRSRKKVLVALRALHERGASPNRIWEEEALLACAAIRYFGNLHDALVTAGIEKAGD